MGDGTHFHRRQPRRRRDKGESETTFENSISKGATTKKIYVTFEDTRTEIISKIDKMYQDITPPQVNIEHIQCKNVITVS